MKHTPITNHRLRWWNHLRYNFGFVPFRRCPGRHRVRNIYGDEIMQAGYMRSSCLDCEKRWSSLFHHDNEVGIHVETFAEEFVRAARRENDGQDCR